MYCQNVLCCYEADYQTQGCQILRDLGMTRYLVKVVLLVLSLVSWNATLAVADRGEQQPGCKSASLCYPFVALLMSHDGICTAAILSPSWMLSSAYYCSKSGGRKFLAYAGTSSAEKVQQRSAEAVVWADPVSGSAAPDGREQLPLMLLVTSAPWSSTASVRPVSIGKLHMSPLALQENSCVAVGFNSLKFVSLTLSDSAARWDVDGLICFNSASSGSVAVARGLLLYCHGADVLIGVGLGKELLPHKRYGRLTTNRPVGSCFAYLGGALLNKLRLIAHNGSFAEDRPERLLKTPSAHQLHRRAANHVVQFIPKSRSAVEIHAIAIFESTTENVYEEDRRRFVWLVKRGFPLTIYPDEPDEMLEYAQTFAAMHHPPPPDARWVLLPVALLAACLLVTYRATVWQLLQHLYMYVGRKKRPLNYQCV